jgi:hypothetical protein
MKLLIKRNQLDTLNFERLSILNNDDSFDQQVSFQPSIHCENYEFKEYLPFFYVNYFNFTSQTLTKNKYEYDCKFTSGFKY